MPEDFQKAIVLSAAPRRKPKQELVAWAKREHLLSNNAKSPGSSSSKKADDSQKAIVPSAAPRSRRLKRKQASVTSEEHEILSPWSCNNANSSRSNTSRKGVQRSSVQPCASQKKLKLGQGLVTLEKHISRPAAPQSTLKQPTKTISSMKARKQHQPDDFPRITVQPAVPRTRSKRKQSLAAPERQAARSEARGSAEEKEYVCFSLWQNFYESECSSGSAEPLVNKRTVRRKKERERLVQIAHSRSIKARPDEEVSSGQTKPPPLHLEVIVIDDEVMTEAPSMDVLAPPADQVVTQAPRAGGQSQPQAPSMDIAAVAPADHRDRSDPSTSMDIVAATPADQVMTQAHADQSQPPAPCSIAAVQVAPPHSVDPPGLTPSNPRTWPAVIDISDDDDD